MYVHVFGGSFTEFPKFGEDPLAQDEDLVALRYARFNARYDPVMVFDTVVNNNPRMFKEAISFFIDLTIELAS